MKDLRVLGCGILLSLMAISCHCGTNVSKQSSNDISGVWYVTKVGDVNVAECGLEESPFISFSPTQNSFSAQLGCNNVSGTFSYNEKGDFRIGDGASTMAMCADMRVEDAFLRVGRSVAKYSVESSSGKMFLMTSEGDTILILSRKKVL